LFEWKVLFGFGLVFLAVVVGEYISVAGQELALNSLGSVGTSGVNVSVGYGQAFP